LLLFRKILYARGQEACRALIIIIIAEMHALSVIILWTSLLAVAAVAQEQQIRLDEDHGKRYNVTLNVSDNHHTTLVTQHVILTC
jgi:hypothetical protein